MGIKQSLAQAIVADLVSRAADAPAPGAAPSIVIVAGHRIDEPGRGETRFPESGVPAVKEKLRETLARLNQGPGGVRILASGAPGTDIICHELCRDLGIKSTICLPTPVDSYSTETFKDLDRWRSCCLALVGDGQRMPAAQRCPRPPKVVARHGHRRVGARQSLGAAIGSQCRRAESVAHCSLGRQHNGGREGGTAHIVQIARTAGTVDIDIIKLKDGTVVAA